MKKLNSLWSASFWKYYIFKLKGLRSCIGNAEKIPLLSFTLCVNTMLMWCSHSTNMQDCFECVFFLFSFVPLQSILLTKTFALISRSVHKDFGRDDVAKRQEHLHELCISELLGEVINKQVATFWPCRWDIESKRFEQEMPKEIRIDQSKKKASKATQEPWKHIKPTMICAHIYIYQYYLLN